MPRRQVRFGLGWLAGLACFLILVLILAFRFWPGGLGGGPKVGVIEVSGFIGQSREILEQLDSVGRDDSIKAVILRIDSPGGLVAPSQEIYQEVSRLRQKKTVVASLGSVAASGGYYIAAAAEKIVASPGTLTASIGVIFEFSNFQELLDKIGVKFLAVKSGRYKDAGTPNRALSPEEQALFQELVDNVHQQFLRDVVKGRNLDPEKVKAVADGRVLSGEQALAAGLVDKLGNFRDAVDLAGSLAGIKQEPELIYLTRSKLPWLARILDSVTEMAVSRLRGGLWPQYLLQP